MKIRMGFVSNSSSSSFVLVFDKKPDLEYFKEVLYENKKIIPYEYNDNYSEPISFTVESLCEAIIEEIERHGELNEEQVNEIIGSGWFEGYPDFPKTYINGKQLPKDECERLWKEHDEECSKRVKILVDKFLKDTKGKYITAAHFDDDTKFGSQLEHGGTFDNIKHMRISHH